MKFKLNNKYVRWGLTAFLVIAAGILFYYFVFHGSNIMAALDRLTDILMPVVFGLATAYLLIPILNFIETRILIPLCDKIGIRPSKRRSSILRGVSVLITAFLFIALIYLLIYMLVSQLVPSIQNIINNFDNYTKNVVNWINRIMNDNPEIKANVIQTVDQFSDQLDEWIRKLPADTSVWLKRLKTVTNTATNIIGVFWDFLIGFIISIYVMASKERFLGQAKKVCYAVFERDTANTVIRNFRFTHKTFIGFISGKIVDSIIIGMLCFIGVTLMNMPYGALISVIIGVTNVIPFFGPYLGAIPSAILILIVDPMHPMRFVYFLIFILVLQQFDGNFLGPKILGNSTGLTSFWVIFAITLFGGLFGIFGMIIGVPVFAVIYAGLKSIVNTALNKKSLPTESNKYEKLEYVDETSEFHDYQPVLSATNDKSKDKRIRRLIRRKTDGKENDRK